MSTWRASSSATTLADGRVLIAGGFAYAPEPPAASAELFDPGSGQWTTTGSMAVGRVDGMTATLLPDGSVLVTGGTHDGPAERYDPETGTWAVAGEDALVIWAAAVTLLPDGAALVAGGIVPGSEAAVATAYRFDPETGGWTAIEPMLEARMGPLAVALDDGRILVVGGSSENNAGVLASAELYDPAAP
jgi:N-acetylneuraminic acid mutarotase